MRVTVALSMLCIATVASCQPGLNWAPVGPPVRVAQILAPSEIASGQTGTFRVDFEGHRAPFKVAYDFDGGVVETQLVHTVGSSSEGQYEYTDSIEVIFDGAASKAITKMLTVRITDASGYSATASTNFTVPAAVELRQPSITSVNVVVPTFQPGQPLIQQLTTELAGTPGLTAVVTVDPPVALQVNPAGRNVRFDAAGLATAGFELTGLGVTDSEVTVFINVDGALPLGGHDQQAYSYGLPRFQPEDDALYAIPMQTSVRVGEPVNILVTTGRMSHPFSFLTGVRVCAPVESGFDVNYHGSFNHGALGGGLEDSDGIWPLLGVENGQFLVLPDMFISPVLTGDGRLAMDFNVTPLGGGEIENGTGDLFNFIATFDKPGTWQLSFQQFSSINRTYYMDSTQTAEHFWSDISNDHPGIPNSVTVIP